MAQTIRQAYDLLAGKAVPKERPPSVAELIAAGETDAVEFKSTLRTNLHTGEKDPKIELMVLKTVAGFLNAKGGTLIVGVADDGSPVGLQADGFPNEDKLSLHLVNMLKDRLGGQNAISVHPHFQDHDGARILVVACELAKSPVWVKDGGAERFFVRYGPSTQELVGAASHEYIKQRFV
jgi:predicted HTH transcriptional regulator